jgi:hypothetical protein
VRGLAYLDLLLPILYVSVSMPCHAPRYDLVVGRSNFILLDNGIGWGLGVITMIYSTFPSFLIRTTRKELKVGSLLCETLETCLRSQS